MDTDSQGVMDIGRFTHRVNAGFFIKHSLSVFISGSTAEIKLIVSRTEERNFLACCRGIPTHGVFRDRFLGAWIAVAWNEEMTVVIPLQGQGLPKMRSADPVPAP